jgi:inward rectifier potassium channel
MPLRRRHHTAKPVPVLRPEFGLMTLGASRFDIRDPYHFAVSLSWPAFVVTLLGTWLAINLCFSLLYVLAPGDITNARPGSFIDTFFFSVETMATVGYGVMAPATTYGHVISTLEIVVGISFTAIFTGLLFVRFSRPKAKIVYAEDAVVTAYRDRHTLMVRLANARMTPMTAATARLFAVLFEHTDEGTFFRRVYELPLMQPYLPLFVLPWTLMHAIDETSPLRGHDANSLVQSDARFFVTVEARDQALAAVVHDIKFYGAQHVRFGMRYADAVQEDEAGHVIADLTRISLLEPDAGGEAEWTRWAR